MDSNNRLDEFLIKQERLEQVTFYSIFIILPNLTKTYYFQIHDGNEDDFSCHDDVKEEVEENIGTEIDDRRNSSLVPPSAQRTVSIMVHAQKPKEVS